MKKFLQRHSQVKKYAFILLIAIEFLMSFTFLGYIHIPPISITFAYIPILVAGCFLGIGQATFLGLLFGLASMYKATAFYVLSSDRMFSPFLSGSPAASLFLSVGTRTLFGLLVGLAFFLVRRFFPYKRLGIGIISFLAPTVHAAMVYTAMALLFPRQNSGVTSTFMLNLSNVFATLLCVVLLQVLWVLYRLPIVRNFCSHVNQPTENLRGRNPLYIAWGIFILFTLCAAIASSCYFANRMSYMLTAHGVTLTSEINRDLLHLQYQFMIAAFSLNFIMAISLMIIYKYLSYKKFLSELDGLTNVMGRKIFLNFCEKIVFQTSSSQSCFIFIDVDYFKNINDTFGHTAGDKVLKQIAQRLLHNFKNYGKIGRLGGDEFAIILDQAPSKQELARKFSTFEEEISDLLSASHKVSCSIGAYYFDTPQDFQTIYAIADKMLYEAKERGRGCWVINE